MVLNVDGLSFELVSFLMGPALAIPEGPLYQLAQIVNEGAGGVVPDFVERIERGESVPFAQMFARRPEASEDLSAGRELWKELTGRELGDDVYMLSCHWTDELAVPRKTLLALVRELRALNDAAPKPPAPWLFRQDPIWWAPAPDEADVLRELEARAAAWDELHRRTPLVSVGPEQLAAAAEVLVKRRTLLAELEHMGFFMDGYAETRIKALTEWGFPTLLGYAEGAHQLHLYLRSRERTMSAWQLPEASRRLLDNPISVDWFRLEHPAAEGREAFTTLSSYEHALRTARLPDIPAGEMLVKEGDVWWRLVWRRETGNVVALVSGEPIQ